MMEDKYPEVMTHVKEIEDLKDEARQRLKEEMEAKGYDIDLVQKMVNGGTKEERDATPGYAAYGQLVYATSNASEFLPKCCLQKLLT